MKRLLIALALIGSPALAQGYYQPLTTFHGTTSNGGYIQGQTSSAGTYVQTTQLAPLSGAQTYGSYPSYPGVATPAPCIPTHYNVYGY